jgi:hypothetical protein
MNPQLTTGRSEPLIIDFGDKLPEGMRPGFWEFSYKNLPKEMQALCAVETQEAINFQPQWNEMMNSPPVGYGAWGFAPQRQIIQSTAQLYRMQSAALYAFMFNPVLTAVINILQAYVFGQEGLKFQAKHLPKKGNPDKKIGRLVEEWLNEDWGKDPRVNLCQWEHDCLNRGIVYGEGFTHKIQIPGRPLIPEFFNSQNIIADIPGGAPWGIRYDEQIPDRPAAFSYAKKIGQEWPFDTSGQFIEHISAEEMQYFTFNLTADVPRGYPTALPIFDIQDYGKKFIRNESQLMNLITAMYVMRTTTVPVTGEIRDIGAASLQASFASGNPQPVGANERMLNITNGIRIVDLPYGTKYEPLNFNGDPVRFMEVEQRIVRIIGAVYGITFPILGNDPRDSNRATANVHNETMDAMNSHKSRTIGREKAALGKSAVEWAVLNEVLPMEALDCRIGVLLNEMDKETPGQKTARVGNRLMQGTYSPQMACEEEGVDFEEVWKGWEDVSKLGEMGKSYAQRWLTGQVEQNGVDAKMGARGAPAADPPNNPQ